MTASQVPDPVTVLPRPAWATADRHPVHHPTHPVFRPAGRTRSARPAGGRLVAVRQLLRALLTPGQDQPQPQELSLVLVGTPADVLRVLREAEDQPGTGYTVVGVVLDGPVDPGDVTRQWGRSRPVVCYVGLEEVGAAVRDLGADAVVVAGPLSEETEGRGEH